MVEIVKITFIGIVGVMLALQFKFIKQDYSIFIGIVVSVFIFMFCIDSFKSMFLRFQTIWSYLGDTSKYLRILLKALGITYICEFGQAICKDAGFSTVADQISIIGKITILFMGLPIIAAVIEQLKILGG